MLLNERLLCVKLSRLRLALLLLLRNVIPVLRLLLMSIHDITSRCPGPALITITVIL